MRNYFLGLCLLFALCFTACSHSDDSVDVLIIGGGASGVTAGIQSARMEAVTSPCRDEAERRKDIYVDVL